MHSDDHDPSSRDQFTATWIEVTIRLGVLGLLLYLSFILVRPFISIVIWSVVLTVALYPVYNWMVDHLGGRRRLAAVLLTILSLLIVIGPATWLALGLIDSLRTLSERLDLSTLMLPPPPDTCEKLAVYRRFYLPVLGSCVEQSPSGIRQDRSVPETDWQQLASDRDGGRYRRHQVLYCSVRCGISIFTSALAS